MTWSKTPALPTQPEMPEPVALLCPEFGPSFPIPLGCLVQHVRFDPSDPKMTSKILKLEVLRPVKLAEHDETRHL